MSVKVLVAEDDARTRAALVELLQREGYDVRASANGSDAIRQFDAERPDLICLDVMMPGKSGYDVCRHVRSSDWRTPILFITAKAEEIDKVVGLELGADDYIVKPFGASEVMARIRAVMRRSIAAPPNTDIDIDADFQMGDLRICPKQFRAQRNTGASIELTPRELRILALLYRRAGEVVQRNDLFREGWSATTIPSSRTLDQTISNLRKRIEADPSHPTIIQTVYGVGYRYFVS